MATLSLPQRTVSWRPTQYVMRTACSLYVRDMQGGQHVEPPFDNNVQESVSWARVWISQRATTGHRLGGRPNSGLGGVGVATSRAGGGPRAVFLAPRSAVMVPCRPEKGIIK
eukprot:SAG31_NODE_259_length_18917_cov_28.559677_10_plen_112_part_00